jgi:hypothetical protein
MGSKNLLFNLEGRAITSDEIREKIAKFGISYKKAIQEIIQNSKVLDKDGEVFVRCTARILSSFGMTRSGPFKGVKMAEDGNVNDKQILLECWNQIGDGLIEIRKSVSNSGYSRDRYLLELSKPERERLLAEIWLITKRLLPFTMGETSYGLVGASKILFAVLPEIVLPVDNNQWLKVFKTVDIGDVINRMANDIQEWENITKHRFNEMDHSRMLTTLPSVYNVMAMDARPKGAEGSQENKI